jgi:hypothetical protein
VIVVYRRAAGAHRAGRRNPDLRAALTVRVGRRTKALQEFVPADVVAGPPVTVQLPTDEIRRVADELRQPQRQNP